MEKISIISLIYQSPEYAEFVYSNILKYTPELHTGEAIFYFVANDATDEVIKYLNEKHYPYLVNHNKQHTDDELFAMGCAFPEYIHRVYAGYNFGIKMADTPIIMLINSDHCFSPDWLINLKKWLTPERAVSPRMWQPHVFPNPINGTKCEVFGFGNSISTFQEDSFLKRAAQLKSNTISEGNAFMPVMLYKDSIEKVGYFPNGNLHDGSYDKIWRTGDTDFFIKLSENGVKHITSNDSIIYHFDCGEREKKV